MLEAADPSQPSAPLQVLVVDDSPAALYATARVLRSAGFGVIEATTGAAALAAAPAVDVVVLDVNLPDIDGFEVCRRLRARPETCRLPVLHLSATFVNSADFALGFEVGADSYLTRPVEPPVLVATVRTLLFARRADFLRRGLDAKLRTLVDLAPVAIASFDAAFCYESANPAYCALTGYPIDELLGKRGDVHLAGAAPDFAAQLAAELDSGRNCSRRVQFFRKDGTKAELEWRLAKEPVGGALILVATDVTEMLLAEAARESLLASERLARAEAERNNRLKEEFLATLSHELRNPLNAILGWATVLSRKAELPEPVKHGLLAIERNSRFQAQMISDLLDYAGITFGKMRLSIDRIDPYPVIRSALDVVGSGAQAAGVEVQAKFGGEPLAVDADAARLQQIVWNLLSNAIKFSTRGGVVTVEAGRSGECLALIVTDQGRGIEPEFLPRIFERFSQQDATTTRSHGGLGLGLAIVKQLTELHGGRVQAFSGGRGRGARFAVTLPLSKGISAAAQSPQKLPRALDFSGLVALVVEDDADARELTKRILADAGAAVLEAASADEAFACIASKPANVLISDIGMAGEDGYQLLRRVRAAGYGADVLPAIALTAFARMEDRDEAFAAGFQDHLVKPLDPQLLIARVAALWPRESLP